MLATRDDTTAGSRELFEDDGLIGGGQEVELDVDQYLKSLPVTLGQESQPPFDQKLAGCSKRARMESEGSDIS